MKMEQTIQAQEQQRGDRQEGSTIRQIGRDVLLFVLAATVCFALATGTIRILHSPDRGLPYRDHFVSSDNAEWIAYGGNWKVQAGTMVNESNERGAKLVSGSAHWQDYTVQADVAMRSLGMRVSLRASPIRNKGWTHTVVFTPDCVFGMRH